MQKYNENTETRQAIDACLMCINHNRANNIGIDNTQADIENLNTMNAPFMERIKTLDHEFYKSAFYENTNGELFNVEMLKEWLSKNTWAKNASFTQVLQKIYQNESN